MNLVELARLVMSDIFSALSLVVSLIALLLSWRIHRENMRLQQRIVEIEERWEKDRLLTTSKGRLHP